MKTQSVIRFAVLCALLAAALAPAEPAQAQKDNRNSGRDAPAKEERYREEAQSKNKERHSGSAAPNKSDGRNDAAAKSGRKSRR